MKAASWTEWLTGGMSKVESGPVGTAGPVPWAARPAGGGLSHTEEA